MHMVPLIVQISELDRFLGRRIYSSWDPIRWHSPSSCGRELH
jgi:hypothetical protein